MQVKLRKNTLKRPLRGEKGQVLILTLILLLIGSLVLAPTLDLMGVGIIGGRVYEQKIAALYAADAGVEDALWHIRNDLVNDLLGGDYNQYDYSTSYPYPYNLLVNNKDVEVAVQNVWLPKDIGPPDPNNPADAAILNMQDENLIILGYPGDEPSTYEIKIVYYWDTTAKRDALNVETIGIWISPGFEYVEGSGTFEKSGGELYYSLPDISDYKGGCAVVWDFNSVRLRDFPPAGSAYPLEKRFTFQFKGPEGHIPELIASWINTTGVDGITYTWDDSIRLYNIVSEADGVQAEAYGAKTKFRKLKATMSMDYVVAGNTLLAGDNPKYRDELIIESGGGVQRIGMEAIPESGISPPGHIPEGAMIEEVYLYWTGFIDYNYRQNTGCGEITALKYPSDPTYENLRPMVEDAARVNIAEFGVGTEMQTITADSWQTVHAVDHQGTWMYSCFKDVTETEVSEGVTVREYIEQAMKSDGSGEVAFTVGHADEVRNERRPENCPGYTTYYFDLFDEGGTPTGQGTGYPLATPAYQVRTCFFGLCWDSYPPRAEFTYAGWSLIVFYRSPAVTQRQIYLYDDFLYISGQRQKETDFPISGFLAPPITTGSHMTYFVGEGDIHYKNHLLVNDIYLYDDVNDWDNIFNSWSTALPGAPYTEGIDLDTFDVSHCIAPYSVSAVITFYTPVELYTLVYVILSFRSELTTGGIITSYTIKVPGQE